MQKSPLPQVNAILTGVLGKINIPMSAKIDIDFCIIRSSKKRRDPKWET